MKKRHKWLILCLTILLLFAFQLQIVVPLLYISLGFILYLFFFVWAKAKALDNYYEGWHFVLNSTRGMLYFLISGSIIWIPVLLAFIGERRQRTRATKSIHTWFEYVKDPMKLHRDWFNNYYQ